MEAWLLPLQLQLNSTMELQNIYYNKSEYVETVS